MVSYKLIIWCCLVVQMLAATDVHYFTTVNHSELLVAGRGKRLL